MSEPLTGAASVKELPPEIWKMILSNLDEAELMKCRLVNKCWRDLANDVFRELTYLWKPTFVTASELVSGRRGTRFSTPDRITRFMEEMKSSNPFPNGTVIFIPSSWDLNFYQEMAFQENFCKLLDAFKDAIFSLVYVIPEILMDKDLSNEFRSILGLNMLKSLVIYVGGNWGYSKTLKLKRFKEMLGSRAIPGKLKEVQIYGDNGVIPFSYMFGGSESALKSVSGLEISNDTRNNELKVPLDPDNRLDMTLCQLPNLKKLKVRCPDSNFLKQFQQFHPNSVACLQEVSVYFESTTALNLSETFALIDLHAETLELLHLEVRHWRSDWRMNPGETKLFSSVKYTNVKTLVISYFKINSCPELIQELVAKLVNLQEVQVTSMPVPRPSILLRVNHPPVFVWNGRRHQYAKIVDLWSILPASVTTIHVPDYEWEIKRGENHQFEDEYYSL